MSLEERVKALEDLVQKITQAFIATPMTKAPLPSPSPTPTSDVLSKFPEQLRQHLTVKDGKIYLNKYLTHGWDEINDIATSLDFHWVKAGKDSHWES